MPIKKASSALFIFLLVNLVGACGGGGDKPGNPGPASSSSSSLSSSVSSNSSIYSADVEHLFNLTSFPIGAAVTNTDNPTYNLLTNTSEQSIVEKHFN